jgi:hypothetical protein
MDVRVDSMKRTVEAVYVPTAAAHANGEDERKKQIPQISV